MKVCITCGIERDVSDFRLHSNGNPRNTCRFCFNERDKVRYYKEGPYRQAKLIGPNRTPEFKDRHSNYMREWRKRNPMKVRQTTLKRYNMTQAKYDLMFEHQGGLCAICRKEDTRNLSMDHDHNCCAGNFSCGKCIRGLLCNNCNVMLGRARDNVQTLMSGALYLAERSR